MDFGNLEQEISWYSLLPWMSYASFPISRVLFVGKDNCLRSAAAEFYFRKYRYSWDMMHACSTGVFVNGHKAQGTLHLKDLSVYRMAREHLDKEVLKFLHTYKARPFSFDLLEAVDLIFCMDESVCLDLRRKYKGISYKIFTLKGFVDRMDDSNKWQRLDIDFNSFSDFQKVRAIVQVKKYVRDLVTILDLLEDVVGDDGVIFDGSMRPTVRGG